MMQKIYLILTLIMMGLKVVMFQKIDEEFEIRKLGFHVFSEKRNLTNLYRDPNNRNLFFRPS